MTVTIRSNEIIVEGETEGTPGLHHVDNNADFGEWDADELVQFINGLFESMNIDREISSDDF